MGSLTVSEADVSETEFQVILARRRRTSEPKLRNCWATIYHDVEGENGEIVYAHSTPAASPLLHAERAAIGKLCVLAGCAHSQQSGTTTGNNLKGKKVKVVKIFCELPPCPGCNTWLTAFATANEVDLEFFFCSDFSGYYDMSASGKKQAWDGYVDRV